MKNIFAQILSASGLLFVVVLFLSSCEAPKEAAAKRPNVVLMFIDDGAFDDYHPFGKPRYPTPHIETLAKEGTSFLNFYVPQAICSASRAALLSGCYPGRTGVFGAHGPNGLGLDTAYATIGEVMKAAGYATGSFGKWHIGDRPHTRPQARGFDETAGLMYSNDMWLHHPENPEYWGQHPLSYWENGEIKIDTVQKEDQTQLTTWYTESAVSFINSHKEEPFFLYVAHSMPHVPLFVSDKFAGKSGTGIYGDVMMEIDWSVGQINQALKDNGLEDNTIFIWIGSDNGPWLSYSDHAGITPFREGKGTTFDGGVRNPCIVKYPPAVKADAFSSKTFNTIDVLPTIAQVTGAALPKNPVDGTNVWPIITDQPGAENESAYYPLSNGRQFQGVVSGDGKWKLHLEHPYRTVRIGGKDGIPGKYMQQVIDTSLFDLVHDPSEKGNVIGVYPEKAAELIELAAQHYDLFYKAREEE